MAEDAEKEEAAVAGDGQPPALSKSARKKQHKQERLAARKAAEKERQRADVERRRHEWEEALAAAPSEEARIEMVAARRERVGQRAEERSARAERLRRAAEGAEQKVVLDLEFGDLMRPNEIHSLPTLPCPATPDQAATYAPDVAQPRRSLAATNAPMRPIPLFLRDDDLAGKSHGLKSPIYSHCVGPKSHGLNASSPPGHATSSAGKLMCALAAHVKRPLATIPRFHAKFLAAKQGVEEFVAHPSYSKTHPTRTCFLSSIDLHNHYSYQANWTFPSRCVVAFVSGIFRNGAQPCKLGCYFSLSGFLMGMKYTKAKQMLKSIPLDRILLETDAPDALPKLGDVSLLTVPVGSSDADIEKHIKDSNSQAATTSNESLNHPANIHVAIHRTCIWQHTPSLQSMLVLSGVVQTMVCSARTISSLVHRALTIIEQEVHCLVDILWVMLVHCQCCPMELGIGAGNLERHRHAQPTNGAREAQG